MGYRSTGRRKGSARLSAHSPVQCRQVFPVTSAVALASLDRMDPNLTVLLLRHTHI
jgi:hypothetical protein